MELHAIVILDGSSDLIQTWHDNLVIRFYQLAQILDAIVSFLPNTNHYDFSIKYSKNPNNQWYLKNQRNQFYDQLDSIGLWETYQKFRASHLLSEFEAWSDAQCQSLCPIHTKYSIQHKKATIDFYIMIAKHKIGYEIEGDTLRKFVQGPNAVQVIETMINHNVFFSQHSPHSTIQRGKAVAKPVRYLKYDAPDDGIFRYQYEFIHQNRPFACIFQDICAGLSALCANDQQVTDLIDAT